MAAAPAGLARCKSVTWRDSPEIDHAERDVVRKRPPPRGSSFYSDLETAPEPISADKLVFVKRIGEGGFGVVDLAKYRESKDAPVIKVAVKRLLPNIQANATEVESFLRECRLLYRMQHASIVKFIGSGMSLNTRIDRAAPDLGIDIKTMFYVQEYCEAGTLNSKILNQMLCFSSTLKEYSAVDALEWCIEIAEGLKFMHSRTPKILHRDLKLDNVLLSPAVADKPGTELPRGSKGRPRAKLVDFGLSLRVQKTETTDGDIKVSKFMTPYTSPTQSECEFDGDDENDASPVARGQDLVSKAASRNSIGAAPDSHVVNRPVARGQDLVSKAASRNSIGAVPDSNVVNQYSEATEINAQDTTVADLNAVNLHLSSLELSTGSSQLSISRAPSFAQSQSFRASQVNAITAKLSGLIKSIKQGAKSVRRTLQHKPAVRALTAQTGSYTYMAPEVFKAQNYDDKVDVFALGVIAYEVFSGTSLAARISIHGLQSEYLKHAKQTSEGVRMTFPKSLPEEVTHLISELWKQDADERPDAAEALEMLIDLRPVVDKWHAEISGSPSRGFGCCFGG